MRKVLISILIVAIGYLISWLFTVGFAWLICLCFGVGFSLKMATGIWLVLFFTQLLLGGHKK